MSGHLRPPLGLAPRPRSASRVALVLPETAESFLTRTVEFSTSGTSGHERFVRPFHIVLIALEAAPWAILTGLGSGATDNLAVPFAYFLITPAKILLEYGLPGLALYMALILASKRTAR